MNPTEPLTVINFAGCALILLTFAFVVLLWVRRRRSPACDFDWRPPDNIAATEDQDYSFCGYENRFAYALGSLIRQPHEATSQTKPIEKTASATDAAQKST